MHVVRLLTSAFALCGACTVAAHPADEILERNLVHVGPDGITVEMTTSAGAVKLLKVWADVDTNDDKRVDDAERDAFGQLLASGYDVRLDGQPMPVTYRHGSLTMAATRQDFELQGADPSGAVVRAVFTLPFSAGATSRDVTFTVNHYNAYSNDRPPEFYPDADAGHAITVQGSNDVDLRFTVAPSVSVRSTAPPVPTIANPSRVAWLLQFVREPRGSVPFVAFGIVIAIALGALHALTPGHGKTLMAAYLVGGRRSVGRACALGGVITLTHTGSVVILGVLTVLLAGVIVPERIILWIELVSSVLIVGLGSALLASRLRAARVALAIGNRRRYARSVPALAAAGDGAFPMHEHDDGTVHAHGWFGDHPHTHVAPAHLSWRSLIAMGVGGGIIPCPDALAILLVAMAAGHVLLGIAIVLGFSAGLAAVLIAIGVLLTTTPLLGRAGARWRWVGRLGPWLPVASAVVIVALGLVTFAHAAPALRP